MGLELWQRVLDFGLEDGTDAQKINYVSLLVSHTLRTEKDSLCGVIGAYTLDKKVYQCLVHQPVSFVVAEKDTSEEQKQRLEAWRVNETALALLRPYVDDLLSKGENNDV